MLAIIKKDLKSFFASISGYLILVIFLCLTGLFLFILPTNFNIFDFGYASLESFFAFVPIVFLFLIPAITMKSISEEIRIGTIDILRTTPVSNLQIILAKFLASFIILIISILPTVIYVVCVNSLALTENSLDFGGIIASFLGLFLIAAAFISIGVFASSISNNQVLSFVIALILSGFLLYGFDLIADFFTQKENFISSLGLSSHYKSMSRGVIDIRDISYFLLIILLFLTFSNLYFEIKLRMFCLKNSRKIFIILGIILVLNVFSNIFILRIDLTEDKRFSLNKTSIELLKKTDKNINFEVYLAGNLPAGMRHLQNSVKELLDEFNAYNTKITYDFIDIHNFDDKTKDSLVGDLVSLGAQPVDLNVKQKDGVKSRQMIFPVAIIAQDNNIDLVELMQSQAGNSQEDIINTSIENLEYQFVSAIYRMSLTEHKKIAFLEGHGELSPQESLDAAYALSAFYDVYRVNLKSDAFSIFDTIDSQIVPFFETIIIAQPKTTFSDLEKWAIDQHIMHGGKVLWFIDDNNASLDTLREMQQQPAISYPTQLGDLLFKYGVRVNNDLVLDLNSNSIPLIVGYSGNQPQTEFFPFFYLPIIVSDNNHILNKNLNPIKTEFISSIDTISNDIKKTAILTTSPYSRKMKTPCIIDFSMLGENLNPLDFSAGKQVVAILLEGNFESAFKRILPNEVRNKSFQSKIISDSNKMIVVADGDIIKNNYNFVQNYPLPLGFDNYTKQSFDNKTFVVNCVNYLCDGDFLLNLRNKTLKIRLLDKQRLLVEERKWQIINLAAPVAMIFVFALIFLLTRKYKNKKFKQQLL